MHHAHSLLVILALLANASGALPQPQMVIVTEQTKQYHRPACPLVRDGKDVIVMNMGQAESRGFRSHPACDPKNAPNPAAQPAPSSNQPSQPVLVYTAAGDQRYHRERCAKLPKERRKVLLEEAGKKLWPCPVCRPPIRKRTQAVPDRSRRE